MPGRPLVVDFDGTLTRLPVDWDFLRRRLGVARVSDVWWSCAPDGWAAVTRAEVAAAAVAPLLDEAAEVAGAAGAFAVLTANAEAAVERFLRRHPVLHAGCRVVVGRETLAGPKTDPEVFRRGLTLCATCLGTTPDGVRYLGDADYEIGLALSLGAEAVPVGRVRGVPASVAPHGVEPGTAER